MLSHPIDSGAFTTWAEVLAHVHSGAPVLYHAPMNLYPVRLSPGKHAWGYEARARTVRIYPPGCFGRGKSRTSDPFTADAGHLSRFAKTGAS